jgi:glycosyltransferase involved in cell wall biosynthesis
MRFGIVVPTLNSARWIPVLLRSFDLSSLDGRELQIHFQDGASNDNTVSIIEEWVAVSAGPKGIRASIRSESDSGPAQAINRGMSLLDCDVLSWLGADDALMPNSIDTLASFFMAFPAQHWVTGCNFSRSLSRTASMLEETARVDCEPSTFSRLQLAKGFHGSAIFGHIQQEGTFWTAEAWERAGSSLDEGLSAAYDFDLWCRLAAYHPLIHLPVALGCFSRRAGQISSNRATYRKERSRVRKRLHTVAMPQEQEFTAFDLTRGLVAKRDSATSQWQILHQSRARHLLNRVRDKAEKIGLPVCEPTVQARNTR